VRPKGATSATGDPVHLSRDGDSMCGIPRAVPRVAPQWAQAHIEGRGITICADCLSVQADEAARPVQEAMDL
jgi:hypothetical protein